MPCEQRKLSWMNNRRLRFQETARFSATARDERNPVPRRAPVGESFQTRSQLAHRPLLAPCQNATKPRMRIMEPPSRPDPFPAGNRVAEQGSPWCPCSPLGTPILRGKAVFVEADRPRHDGESRGWCCRVTSTGLPAVTFNPCSWDPRYMKGENQPFVLRLVMRRAASRECGSV